MPATETPVPETPAPEDPPTATPAPAMPVTGQTDGPGFLATALLAFGVLFVGGGGLLLWRALAPGRRTA